MGLVLGRCKPASPETQRSGDQQSEPERQVLLGLVRRWFFAAPLLALICALLWGLNGLWSSLLAVGLVLVNFILGSAAITFGGAHLDAGHRPISAAWLPVSHGLDGRGGAAGAARCVV